MTLFLRPGLTWTLFATLALSALAWWWPVAQPPALVRTASPAIGPPGQPHAPAAAARSALAPLQLPNSLPGGPVKQAAGDPFVEMPSPAAPAQAAVAKTASPPRRPPTAPAAGMLPSPAPPPLPPSPPPTALTLAAPRLLGTMVTPQGQRVVMLARGDNPIVVQPGMRLEDGSLVQAVETHAVRLLHEPSGRAYEVPIPPAPSIQPTSRKSPAPPVAAAVASSP